MFSGAVCMNTITSCVELSERRHLHISYIHLGLPFRHLACSGKLSRVMFLQRVIHCHLSPTQFVSGHSLSTSIYLPIFKRSEHLTGVMLTTIFSLPQKKPYSAVTVQIERLTSEQYEPDDLSGIVDLIEVIRLQSSGPIEAARAIRKKL